VKREPTNVRKTDDKTCKADTGRTRAEWFAAINKAAATGRSAVGKFLQGEKVEAWWTTALMVEYEAANGIVEKDGRPKGYSICSTKTVAALPSRTFKALTSSAELSKWFGPGASIDASEGGAIADKDGVRGTVKKVKPDKAIVFTWDTPGLAAGSLVEILVQPKGEKTGLVVNHTRVATAEDADAVRASWAKALDRLKGYLEA
jgi:uncharacterized protein YndB with AHSA1/START domain